MANGSWADHNRMTALRGLCRWRGIRRVGTSCGSPGSWRRVRQQELRGLQSQHRIGAPQLLHPHRVFRLRELALKHPLAQTPYLEFVKLADEFADTLGRGMRQRAHPVALEIAKDVGAVGVRHVSKARAGADAGPHTDSVRLTASKFA